MFKKNLIIALTLIAGFMILAAVPVLAQNAPPAGGGGVKELQDNLGDFGGGIGFQRGDTDLKGRIAQIVNIALGIIGIVAVIYIITGGYKWIMAEGNEEEIKKSKETIRSAIIGLLVVFISYIVVNFVVSQLTQATTTSLPGPGAGTGTNPPGGTQVIR